MTEHVDLLSEPLTPTTDEQRAYNRGYADGRESTLDGLNPVIERLQADLRAARSATPSSEERCTTGADGIIQCPDCNGIDEHRATPDNAGGSSIDQEAASADAGGSLREFAEDVARQWGYVGNGAIHTGGLSTLEEAFAILGWDDPHPLDEGDPAVCDEPGCGAATSTGWPTRPGGTGLNGGYRRTCHEHSDFHQKRFCKWPADSSHWGAASEAAASASSPLSESTGSEGPR